VKHFAKCVPGQDSAGGLGSIREIAAVCQRSVARSYSKSDKDFSVILSNAKNQAHRGTLLME
jgi:hypothetical protein